MTDWDLQHVNTCFFTLTYAVVRKFRFVFVARNRNSHGNEK